LRLATFAVLLALSAPAIAQDGGAAARSIEDCENLPGVDEYNHCLARFGPPATAVGAGTARPPRGADPEAETQTSSMPKRPPAATTQRTSSRRASAERRVRGGRQSATFTVVTGRRSTGRAARGTPQPARRRR
jgi:hypothetical protein